MKTFNQFVDEGVLTAIGKKKPEKKAEKAMDAGARAKRKLARKVHAKYVSGSEDLVPDSIREGMIDVIKKGAKRHATAVEKKKIKNRKAVPYAALAAEHTPEGEVIDEISKATLASYIKKGSEDAVKRMGDASRAGMSGRRKEADKGYDKAHKRVAGVRTAATKLQYKKEEVVYEGDVHSGQGEKIQKRTKAWMDKKGQKGAPGLDAMKARTAEHKAKRGVKEEVVDEGIRRSIKKGLRLAKREAGRMVVDDPGDMHTYGSLGNPKPGDKAKRDKERAAKRGVKEEVVDEAKVDQGRSDYGKASIRNYRRSGPGHGEPAMFDPENKRGKLIDKRREEHKKRRGVKGAKVPAYKVNEEDKAFDYVVAKLKAKHGDGVLTTGEKMKPQSAADKAKARAHQAKVDAENAAERRKDPSQGRYPKG